MSLKGGCLAAAVAIVVAAELPLTSCTSKVDDFAVDSVVVDRSWVMSEAMENDALGGRSYFYGVVDYPKNSNSELFPAMTDSVRLWISQQLLPDSEEPVLTRRVVEEAVDIFFGEDGGNEWGANMSVSLRKVYEDADYVSYDASRYTFYGGAHGMCSIYGATFRKTDGRRLTWNDFPRTDDLRRKITASMTRERKYKAEDELMATLLFPDNDENKLTDGTPALPFPKVDPWLTNEGWVFSYQPYEIMCWAEGAPACRLSKDEFSFSQE